jgi:hypothetical protein
MPSMTYIAHRRWRAALSPALAVVYLAALVTPALAAPARGRSTQQRENDARTACAAGRVDEGIEILAELFAETEHANYVFNQGRCYQQNGRNEQALSRFREFLRLAPMVDTEIRTRTERYIKELEGGVRPAAGPPRGESVPPPRPAPRQPMPTTTSTTGTITSAPPAQRSGSSGLGVAAATLGIVGAVALVGGVVSGLQVQSLTHKAEQAKAGTLNVDDLSNNADKAHRFEVFQWIGYGIAGAALLGALVCVAVDRKSDSRAQARVLPVAGLIGGNPAVGLSGRF